MSSIALFFDTQADINKGVLKEYNDAVSPEGTSEFSKKTYTTEDMRISSGAEFLGVRFAPAWRDHKRNVWQVLAYIDKREAAGIYEAQIRQGMNSVEALWKDAGDETPLAAAILLSRAKKIGAVAMEEIRLAAKVDPDTQKYRADTALLAQVDSALRAARRGVSFTVRVTGADSSGQIQRALESLFERYDFVTEGDGGIYTVTAAVSGQEEGTSVGVFVRCGVTVRVRDPDRRTLLSYSKNYPRVSHNTAAEAYTRAYAGIERDLEENFVKKLAGLFGE
ncbi:MAG: hypothetical protein LBR23_02175 [Spirochaetaceae bacterium]|nr:hypothetical protein [Spirochaetaceae bacterium]